MKKQVGKSIRKIGMSLERFGKRVENGGGVSKKRKTKRGKLTKSDIIKILVFFLIINNVVFLAGFNSAFAGKGEVEQVDVTRVIDGDTFEAGARKIRLLGLNAPEVGKLGALPAKNFLLQFKGKTVDIECEEKDQYNRDLCYVYDGNKLINEEILKLGLAHLYYYDKDDKTAKLEKAENKAREEELGIWKKSKNYGCVEIIELKYEEEERCTDDEQLVLFNSCNKFNAVLKDDATHIYDIEIGDVFAGTYSCIWNDEGDSVYIWDKEGLVLFHRYS